MAMAPSTTQPNQPAPGAYVLPFAATEPEAGNPLQSVAKILRRRQKLFLLTAAGVTLVFGLTTVFRRITAPVFQGSFTLLISDPISDTATREGAESGGAIASVARNVARNDVPTLIRVLESPAVLEPVYNTLQKKFPDQPLPQINVSLVSADPSQRSAILASGVLSVEARGISPDLVEQSLRLTESAYLEWALQQRRQKLREGVRFLDQQAPQLQARSAEIQGELERFRVRNNVLNPESEATSLRGQSEGLRATLLSQQAERQRLLELRQEVASGKLIASGFSTTAGSGRGSTGSEGSSTGTSLTLDVPNQPLLTELNALEAQIAAARSTYLPSSSYLQNLIAARDNLKPLLQQKQLETVDATLKQLDGSMASLQSQINRLESSFQNQPGRLREYEALQQKLTIAQDNLASYLSTRDQFQLEIAQNNVPWSVISPASVIPSPVEPNVGRGLLQGLLLGLLAGTGVALLRDRFDHVFHSPSEVRDELKVPLLGHIPFISFFEGVRRQKRFLLKELDSQQDGIAGYQRFTYQESFRNLYTSIRFLNSDQPVRSIAVSSSIPAEGKSLLIVLLAKTLSELGQRVLLVDADLRQPQVHHRLGLNNLEGLSNLLIEDRSDWRELLQNVPDHQGWDVLTAGRRAPDPPRLLSSARMGRLIEEIAQSGLYDLILYDTPPVLGLADASLLAENLDGILLVVGLNKVDRQLPAEAIERIKLAGAPLLGIVTNALADTDSQSKVYGYSKYGYGNYNQGATALDPSTTYSYYTAGAEKSPKPKAKGLAAIVPNASNRSQWKKNISKWLG